MSLNLLPTLNAAGEFCIKFLHHDKDESVIQQQLGVFIKNAELRGIKLVKTGDYVDISGNSWDAYSIQVGDTPPKFGSQYKTSQCDGAKGRIEQLLQLLQLTQDGDLINKAERDELIKKGLATKVDGGWNIITDQGIHMLNAFGYIHP